jgi:CheY-like chemotaxis protein
VTKHIAIISSKPDSIWVQTVSKATHALGKLHVISDKGSEMSLVPSNCDLIILDATDLSQDIAALVGQLRGEQPQTPIVVATTSPTWQRARQAFRAGANDYIRKSLDEQKTMASLQAVLGE